MLVVHPLFATVQLLLTEDVFLVSSSIEQEVEAVWQAELKRRGDTLFNGQIMSAYAITPECIYGQIVEYRYWIAQKIRPELFDALRIRPLAVSGLLECKEGIVFGARSATVTQDAGLWELVPSGGIDTARSKPGTTVSYVDQIKAELSEEMGVSADAIADIRPFCLVEDEELHVIDIGIALSATLTFDQITTLFAANKTKEYQQLRLVASKDIEAFIQEHTSSLVGVSIKLLEHYLRRN